MTKHIMEKPRAVSIMNFALGTFILAIGLDNLFKEKTGYLTYFLLGISSLIILISLRDFYKKSARLEYNKRLGYLNIFIGTTFTISMILNWYQSSINIYSIILGLIAGSVSLILGVRLLTTKN